MTVKYSKDHEWISIEGDEATIGVTDYAQNALGDVVFVELPEVGANLTQGDEAAVVESVKAASEVYAPVSGEVIAVNDALVDAPDMVNSDPEGEGWFFKLRLADKGQIDELMDEDGYKSFIAELE
ncbi:MAG: glycine cleavage system protein GcvH [Sphingomonadales bacterium]|jgi:glycine cleavage system H protein